MAVRGFGVRFSAVCIAACAMLCQARSTNALTIDDFSDNSQSSADAISQVPAVGYALELSGDSRSIGGSRALRAEAVQGGIVLATRFDRLTHDQGANSRGRTRVVWDGRVSNATPDTINFTGLGSVNLLQDGGDSLLLEGLTFDFANSGAAVIDIFLYDASDPAGGKVASITRLLDRQYSNETLTLPFSEFSVVGISKSEVGKQVGAIKLELTAFTNGSDIEIDRISTNGQCVVVPGSNGQAIDSCGICRGESNFGLGKDSCGFCPGQQGYNRRDECNFCFGDSNFGKGRDVCLYCPGDDSYQIGKDVCGFCPGDSGYNTFSCRQCGDGQDNDGDGKTDFPNDPGCTGKDDNDETDPLAECQDGLDNDGDGAADFPTDFSCSGPGDNTEGDPKAQCQDGIDNDGDGKIDFPEDIGCLSAQDNDEMNTPAQCQDGKDNDGDKKIDYPNDPGCSSPSDNDESSGESACSDGIDNDNDGKVDYPQDPECSSSADDDESQSGPQSCSEQTVNSFAQENNLKLAEVGYAGTEYLSEFTALASAGYARTGKSALRAKEKFKTLLDAVLFQLQQDILLCSSSNIEIPVGQQCYKVVNGVLAQYLQNLKRLDQAVRRSQRRALFFSRYYEKGAVSSRTPAFRAARKKLWATRKRRTREKTYSALRVNALQVPGEFEVCRGA